MLTCAVLCTNQGPSLWTVTNAYNFIPVLNFPLKVPLRFINLLDSKTGKMIHEKSKRDIEKQGMTDMFFKVPVMLHC